MKHLALTTALCAAMATGVAADQKMRLSPDQLRKDMVVSTQSFDIAEGSAATSSGAGLLIPLLLIVVLAAAVSSGGGGHGHHYYPY
ncbi:hypothetical protein [Maliponia aquimaris]|uniref:Ferrochelatase n=1 Tax=Maliponia aquimaris TaxID=1673631 RepID=A0A238K0U0_9RHOB|nr:hypothetical protein [Maliponia aquimaris]SMX36528.1 hypothetical protein MAA8898_00901 [Maliponia aquimaris]